MGTDFGFEDKCGSLYWLPVRPGRQTLFCRAAWGGHMRWPRARLMLRLTGRRAGGDDRHLQRIEDLITGDVVDERGMILVINRGDNVT